jgi:hypothetical protein
MAAASVWRPRHREIRRCIFTQCTLYVAIRGQLAHLGEQLERLRSLFRIEFVQRVADMDDHIVADRHAVDQGQRDFLAHPGQVDHGALSLAQFNDLRGNGQTHRYTSSFMVFTPPVHQRAGKSRK